jgi:hypothetical protein
MVLFARSIIFFRMTDPYLKQKIQVINLIQEMLASDHLIIFHKNLLRDSYRSTTCIVKLSDQIYYLY